MEWMGQSGNYSAGTHATPPGLNVADRFGYTGAESDKWQWFEAIAIAMALGIERLVHFTWNQEGDFYNDVSFLFPKCPVEQSSRLIPHHPVFQAVLAGEC
jgi:hypothetical protein